jgi:phosphohistidine phosphatase SixA
MHIACANLKTLDLISFNANGPIMTSNFSHALDELSARYRALRKSARLALLILGAFLLLSITAFALKPAPMTDLAEGHHSRSADLYSLWDQGDVVILMRHVERCDHSTNPCLAQPDGITVKGQRVADRMGQALHQLGLTQADIYNSPLRRTEQTSSFVFNRAATAQDWLINCRGSMLDNVLKHKQDHHNLILVTHSECVSALEKSLNVPSPVSLDYGASLILSVNPDDHSTRVLGFIDARDWGKVLAHKT